jgi:hypothetical protein
MGSLRPQNNSSLRYYVWDAEYVYCLIYIKTIFLSLARTGSLITIRLTHPTTQQSFVQLLITFNSRLVMKSQKRSFTLSITSPLNFSGWSKSRRGLFTLMKETRDPLYSRLCGSQGRSGRVRKFSTPPGFDPRTAKPAASRYTD